MNMKIFKLPIIIGLLLILMISPIRITIASGSETEIDLALDYLRSSQNSAGDIDGYEISTWAVMAIAAAGEDPHIWRTNSANPSIVDYLKNNIDHIPKLFNVANGYSKTIMALIDAGEDPTDVDGTNLVDRLKTYYDGNQIGDPTLVNDDFWGVLALIAAGEASNSEIIQKTITFIKNSQQDDGGWGWDVAATWGTDPDDTAAAVMALAAAGENPNSIVIIDALSYLKNTQGDKGGFLSWGMENADSTAWAIQAIIAADQDPESETWKKNSNTPKDFLRSLQNTDGSFSWTSNNPGGFPAQTTAMSIVALKSLTFPIHKIRNDSGYSEEQLKAIEDAKTMLASGETVKDAYELLLDTGIIHGKISTNFNESGLAHRLVELYGMQLEEYPTFEGRIQLLILIGIDTIEISPPIQKEIILNVTLPPDKARLEAETLLETEGVDAAYNVLIQNRLIRNEITISKNSCAHHLLIERYGLDLEKYPLIDGRIQLLKALAIE